MESPSKEIDDTKKNQTETLELKNIMTNIFQNFGKDINLQLQKLNKQNKAEEIHTNLHHNQTFES